MNEQKQANDFIKGIAGVRADLQGEFDAQKKRFDEAESYLAEAEETRAKFEMAAKKKKFDSFKTTYNTMKTRYDALDAKENDGTITPQEVTEMADLRAKYEKDKEVYDGFEEERRQAERDAQMKEFNKSKMATEKFQKAARMAERQYADMEKAKTTVEKEFNDLKE